MTEPVSVNASGDYIRNLKLGEQKDPRLIQPITLGSTDRMADFFHALAGHEGTLRNWNTETTATKIAQLNVYERPEKGKDLTAEQYNRAFKAWHSFMCGVLFFEARAETPDRLVAQAAFDHLFPGKVGKR